MQRTEKLKSDGYEPVTCNEDAILYLDHTEQDICVEYPVNNDPVTVTMKKIDKQIFQYNLIYNSAKQSFTYSKSIQKLGSTNRDGLFKLFVDKIMDLNAMPTCIRGQPQWRAEYIVGRFGELTTGEIRLIESTLKSWESVNKEENKVSWFEMMGEFDKFDGETLRKAEDALHKTTVIDDIYDIIELKVIAQKPKAILEFLMALSSVFPKPLHSLIAAMPGKSKTTISKTVYDLFPKQRRMKFSKTSSVAGILNMTKYKEGSHILEYKLIRVGDFGSKEEQKQAEEIISLLKELMSEAEYDKILTDMTDEFGKAMILKLRGCGSVHMEIISPTAESQYMSRALLWSPDDNKQVQNSIMEYQEDELLKIEKDAWFDKQRFFAAAIIDKLFQFVDDIREDGGRFEILNPYTSHFNALLNVKNSPNANRDRLMIQTIPKLVTLANCYNRDLFYNEKLGSYALIVNKDDYLYTVKLLGRTLSHFIHKKPEVLQTYTTIIESHLYHAEGIIRTLTYDDLKRAVDMGKNPEGRFKTGMNDDDQIRDEKKEMLEFLEIFRDAKYFTYEDIARFTTVQGDTVRGHLKELAEMQLVVVDTNYRPHRVYIPSDYYEKKKIAFSGIFDYNYLLESELKRENRSDFNPFSLQESFILSIYEEFIKKANYKGWVKSSNRFFNKDMVGMNGGDGLDEMCD